MELKGIDVSSNQGKPDWAKVAKAGVKFAILRVHQRSGIDSSFEYNYKGCKNNGILIGGYKYSYALTPAQALDEAEDTIAALNGRGLDFPVFYDLEWSNQRKLGKQAIENITVAFLTRMKKAGYKVGVYCNYDWYKNCLSNALKQYECWIANYPKKELDNGTLQERLRVPVGVGWQYSEHGKVSGISGNVDMDVFYKDYRGATQKGETTVAKTKLQKFLELGDYYASNGGYLEKKSDAYLDDFKKNAGYNNYTRFARDVNSWGQPGCQAQPWCAEYQFWKLVKVLGITRALQIMGGGFYNCKSITNHAKSNGTWHKSPKVGALIIFRNGSHVGSARSFNGSVVYTNEGNTSSAAGVVANGGAVRNKSYAINDSAIDGYVWIDWGSEGQTAAWKATGTATSTADDLYVRESPNGYVLGKINKGNRVEINGEKSGAWTKIKVAGIGIGWVATKYLAVDGAKNVAATATVIVKKQDKNQRLYTGQVTASSLNVRTWAGAEYPNIKKYPTLNKGNKVDVMNFTQKASDGSSWYYIRIAGKYFGFVSAKYIKKV
jgi:GH25 family lysozyme M1 (1,4-beta-N-acetylmuramidase)